MNNFVFKIFYVNSDTLLKRTVCFRHTVRDPDKNVALNTVLEQAACCSDESFSLAFHSYIAAYRVQEEVHRGFTNIMFFLESLLHS